jgi:hypothetical protein
VFSGNGSTTAFTLTSDPSTKNNTSVFISGVYQQKSTYTQSGTTITFSTAPPSGTSNIEIAYSTPLAIGTPSDGTVTTAKIVDANVTYAKIQNVTAGKLLGRDSSGSGVVQELPIAVDNTGNINMSQSLNSAVTIRLENTNTGSSAQTRFLAVSDGGNIQVKAVSTTNTTYGSADSGVINCDSMSGGMRFSHDDVVRMVIDTSGRVTKPYQPSFHAYRTAGHVMGNGTEILIVWNAVVVNVGSNYNSANGRFTAPVAGRYYFSANGMVTGSSSGDHQIKIKKNGNDYNISNPGAVLAAAPFAAMAIIDLAVGDYVECYYYDNSTSTGLYASGGVWNHFCGHLIG